MTNPRVALLVFTVLLHCTDQAIVNPRRITSNDVAIPSVNNNKLKVDCYPDKGSGEDACKNRGCVWEPAWGTQEPWCYLPDDFGYTVTSEASGKTGMQLTIERKAGQHSLYGGDVDLVHVDIVYATENCVRITMRDPNNTRYEVPVDVQTTRKSDDNDYEVLVQGEPVFGLVIRRKSTGTVVFDTRVSGFAYSDQYLQIVTMLPSDRVFGIGEQMHGQFRHDLNYRSWSIFTRDVPPTPNNNLYGSQPFHIALEEDGKATGVFFLNSNAMRYTLMPNPAMTVSAIGGIFDIFVFMGPTMDDVVRQYLQTVGTPQTPPYWGLGFQLCRWGYNDTSNLKAVFNRNFDAGLPMDIQYTDIDYMDGTKDFTISPTNFSDLPGFIDEIHGKGVHYVPILDPAIAGDPKLKGKYPPLDQGLDQDVFIKKANGEILEGSVWPGNTYFPDFSANKTIVWWKNQIKSLHDQVSFDGLWIDMNEPSNFDDGSKQGCEKNKWNYPPFAEGILGSEGDGKLFAKTLCADAVQEAGRHYDVHNLYGYFEAKATKQALEDLQPGKRTFILSRSNYASMGKYAAHWTGDNYANWDYLKLSIATMLEFNLFGVPFVGSDICGFQDNSNAELCLRWMQLGAFYPFARNHNTLGAIDQDPASFSDASVPTLAASIKVLNERYRLLPYLYTLMLQAQLGEIGTVVRSLVQEYPTYARASDVTYQFLWGPALLISPVLDPDTTTVDAYFPTDVWYDYYTGKRVEFVGRTVTLDAPLDGNIPLHVRGGYIIPRQDPAQTTAASRKNPMNLIVAIGPLQKARGSLIWDDGESVLTDTSYDYLDFSLSNGLLNINVTKSAGSAKDLNFSQVAFYGVEVNPTQILVDGKQAEFTYHSDTQVLTVSANLSLSTSHQIQLK